MTAFVPPGRLRGAQAATSERGNDATNKYNQFFDMGIDGVAGDFLDTAQAARDAFIERR